MFETDFVFHQKQRNLNYGDKLQIFKRLVVEPTSLTPFPFDNERVGLMPTLDKHSFECVCEGTRVHTYPGQTVASKRLLYKHFGLAPAPSKPGQMTHYCEVKEVSLFRVSKRSETFTLGAANLGSCASKKRPGDSRAAGAETPEKQLHKLVG